MSQPEVILVDLLLDGTLDSVHARACDFITKFHAEHGCVPCLYVIDNGMALTWINCPWEDRDEMAFHASMVAKMLRRFDAQHYAHVTEAYFKRLRDDDGDGEPRIVSRDEGVMVMTISQDGRRKFTRWFVSEIDGRNYLGQPEHLDDADEFTGLLANLFADPIGENEHGH